MKQHITILFCLLSLVSFLFATPSVAVIDFDSGSFCTAQEASVMTDAFRNELVRAGRADVVDRNHTEQLKAEMRFQMSDWVDPSKIKQAGHLLGVEYFAFGNFGIMGGTGYLQVQMTEIETGRILYSARMTLNYWQEFDQKVRAFTQEFVSRFPAENIFTGAWTSDILHDGIIDTYTITFTGANRCTVRVTSLVNRREITEEGQGTYSYNDDILRITAVFRNSKIPHISSIQWSSVISIDGGNTSFNMLAKPTSTSTQQVRVSFVKD
jgi:TolB-like protein